MTGQQRLDWVRRVSSAGQPVRSCLRFARLSFTKKLSWLLVLFAGLLLQVTPLSAALTVGRAIVDVTPRQLPVIKNGGFLEASANRVVDPLFARCLVLDDGDRRIAIVVVDSCMIPRDLCDQIKQLASEGSGIALSDMMISATHTHAAPSVMDYTLGSRADPAYRVQLPQQVAESIVRAASNLQPAKVGFARVDAGHLTKNRRWITRPDTMMVDPFGDRTVRAMMHPGHQNPNFTGPSGPADPWLSLISFTDQNDEPLAVFANFSMHYFGGHPGISADYFSLFCQRLSARLAPDNDRHLSLLSQGTSGDLWWGDYAKPSQARTMADFADELVALSIKALGEVEHRADADLAMDEHRVRLKRRTPDENRLAWAERKLKLMGNRRPQDRPEVYAEQAKFLNENPDEEIVLQAIRIGNVAITGMPNEVYALTGIKLRFQSPLPNLFNISLANGAAGYIPPPEQHLLGGYTTWPARTAGLAVDAEPKIVARLLDSLEKISETQRHSVTEVPTAASRDVLNHGPIRFWRLGELAGTEALDSSPHQVAAKFEGSIAFCLPGINGHQPEPLSSRAVHFAGGHLRAKDLPVEDAYTLSLWCNSMVPNTWREVTGAIYQWGDQILRVTGKADERPGCLGLGEQVGKRPLQVGEWHHVVAIHDGQKLTVYLDGRLEISVPAQPVPPPQQPLLIGGATAETSWEGKIDEVALFARTLDAQQIQQLYAAAHDRQASRPAKRLPLTELGALPDLSPRSPAESMELAKVREGFQLELVAAEPMVADPVAIEWDRKGRLWVAEMGDYPYGVDGKGAAGGRIRRLDDSNGDGQYDRSIVFLEGLSFPTAVLPWRDGVLIAAAPQLIFARDIDDDGRADSVRVLFRGFMEGNQQLRVNGLRYGLDNLVYCANGGHHAGFGAANSIELVMSGAEFPLGSRDFCFQPDTGQLEARSGPSQFGRVRDDWGDWFGVQNSHPIWHYVLDDRYLRRNNEVTFPDIRRQLRPPSNPPVFSAKPPQKRFHSFNNSGHYTSACGPAIYRDEILFGASDDVIHAFTCEPFHNVVQHHWLTNDGVSFQGQRAETNEAFDFFASADRWCRPVLVRTGPDGALWVVDMYRYLIEHPDWLPVEAREELKPYYRAGESFGRIYRIYPQGSARPPLPGPTAETVDGLVAQLVSSNGVLRDKAQQQLVTNLAQDAVPALRQLLRQHEQAKARLHALATLSGVSGVSHDDIIVALNDSHPAVRCLALRLLESYPENDELIRAAGRLQDDPELKVQLQLACSLGEYPGDLAGQILRQMTEQVEDETITLALTSSFQRHFEEAVSGVLNRANADRRLWDAVLRMSLTRPAQIRQIASQLIPSQGQFSSTSQLEKLTLWSEILVEHGRSLAELLREDAGNAGDYLDHLNQAYDVAWKTAADAECPAEECIRAIRLARFDSRTTSTQSGAKQLDTLVQLLGNNQSPAIQHAALELVATQVDAKLAESVLEAWDSYSPNTRQYALDQMLSSEVGTLAIVNALATGLISPLDLDAARRQRLMQYDNDVVAQRATEVFSELRRPDRQTTLRELQTVLKLEGTVSNGAKLFAKHCTSCHGENDSTRIGPQLKSLTDRSNRTLLHAILDPNEAVEPRYLGYSVELKSGQTYFGIVIAESGNSLVIQTLDGNRREIARSSVEALHSSGKSFMPEGLEAELDVQALADVIAYIQSL